MVVARSTELIGRAAELAALLARAGEAALGAARLVAVTGEAGIGKTRLVEELVGCLDERWCVVGLGSGRADRRGARLEGAGDDESLAAALVDRLAVADRAVAAVLEDAHWLDPTILRALPAALDRVDGRGVLVVLTYRLGSHPPGSPHPAALARLLRHPMAAEVRLHGLAPGDSTALATALGHPSPERLHERTGGNPLLVEHAATAVPGAAPTSLHDVVRGQLDALDDAAARLAEMLAVAGGALEWAAVRVAARVVAPGGAFDVDAGFAVLRDAGLAAWSGPDQVALRHAAVGEAVVATTAVERRRRLHVAIAAGLATVPDVDPLRMVSHLWSGGDHASAVDLAVAAARVAADERRHHDAAGLYEVALRGGSSAALLTEALKAAARAGDLALAASWAADAVALHEAAGDDHAAAAVWRLPELRYIVKPDVAADRLAPGSVARLLEETRALVAAGEPEVALATAHLAVKAAEARPTDLFDGARALYYAGDLPAALGAAHDAAQAMQRVGNPLGESDALSIAAQVSFAAGDVAGATACMRRAVAAAQADPAAPYWGLAVATFAMLLAARGELASAEAELDRLDGSPMAEMFAALPRAAVAIERGEVDRARELAGPLPDLYRTIGSDFGVAQALVTLAGIAVVSGDHVGVRALVREARAAEPALHSYLGPDLLLFDALAARSLGDLDGLDDALASVADHARVGNGATVSAAMAAIAGLRASAHGDHRAAAASLQHAARAFSSAPRYPLAGHAWCLAAEEQRHVGENPRAALDEAIAIARRHGIVRVERMALRLRTSARPASAGHRHGGEPGTARSRAGGLALLTPRELEVIRLVAAGLTNREIGATTGLAETTVRNYLASAFAKLHITRRTQVASRLRELGDAS